MTMIVIGVIVVLLIIMYVSGYNGLVKAKIRTEESWSQIDVQLKRRNEIGRAHV